MSSEAIWRMMGRASGGGHAGVQAGVVEHFQQELVMGRQEGEFLVVVEDRRPREGAVVGEAEALGQLLVDARQGRRSGCSARISATALV